jgi:hypothetical protein
MAKQHSPDATLKARFACSNHAPSYAETVVLVCVEHKVAGEAVGMRSADFDARRPTAVEGGGAGEVAHQELVLRTRQLLHRP